MTTYVFLLTPVDAVVTHYNVGRIIAGDPAPSVQITEHPISAEGILLLEPLVDAKNPKVPDEIREGVRAMLAEHAASRPKRWRPRAERKVGPPSRWPTGSF